MTTDNATELRAGTLVLADGHVRMFSFRDCGKDYFAHERLDGKASIAVDWVKRFTVIGHPGDGWLEHTTSECPVGADERVEVFFRLGVKNADDPGLASRWFWDQRQGKHTIVAYRVIKPSPVRQEPNPQPIAPSDLRAGDRVRVTVEGKLRGRVEGDWWTDTTSGEICWLDDDLRQSTIYLLSREPEPLKENDRAKWCGKSVRIYRINHEAGEAWIIDLPRVNCIVSLSELQPITPEKAS